MPSQQGRSGWLQAAVLWVVLLCFVAPLGWFAYKQGGFSALAHDLIGVAIPVMIIGAVTHRWNAFAHRFWWLSCAAAMFGAASACFLIARELLCTAIWGTIAAGFLILSLVLERRRAERPV